MQADWTIRQQLEQPGFCCHSPQRGPTYSMRFPYRESLWLMMFLTCSSRSAWQNARLCLLPPLPLHCLVLTIESREFPGIVSTSPLLDAWSTNIFFQSVARPFSPCARCFPEHRRLVLTPLSVPAFTWAARASGVAPETPSPDLGA